jgi:hypothetical protein
MKEHIFSAIAVGAMDYPPSEEVPVRVEVDRFLIF